MNGTFAQRLKELRTESKLSQAKLAERLKMSQSGLSNWETGDNQPDTGSLIKLADIFEVTVDYLIGRSSIKESKPLIDSEIASKIALLSPISQEAINNLVDELIKKSTKK
ncbi:MAG: helix-turn-helix transcriptional regulator [Bacilli bacterium]|nr:helix-turn-helix transcriptional regulator [Bacilli bacterium]